jgi:type II secretory pathway pseudopilin PulG
MHCTPDRIAPWSSHPHRDRRDRAHPHRPRHPSPAFTLAEVLAALVFLAIVIPVTIEGLRVAHRASQSALRQSIALRLAESILEEWQLPGSPLAGQSTGIAYDGPFAFPWNLRVEPWPVDALSLVTIEIRYPLQEREQSVELSTLVTSTLW